jgi:hypothetical protein
MKYIILAALFSVSAFASKDCSVTRSNHEVLEEKVITTDVPSHLKGAKIIVKLADGKESEVPAELFKVVPRKKQVIVTKVQNDTVMTCNGEGYKNRISLLAGHGTRSGMRKSVGTDVAEFETKTGLVGGAQYQRVIKGRLSVGGQVQTNKTGSLMLGLDF